MPEKHALLSASASHRWLRCTAAPRFEEQLPENPPTTYALEGTLAHSICELVARKRFTPMSLRKFNAELTVLQEKPLFHPEMMKTAEFYVDYLAQTANGYDEIPYIALEVEVDYSQWAPEGFGTSDCVMIGGNTLHVTDYKHGKGDPVSATENSQMRLYALGALAKYQPIYGDRIKQIHTSIVQPRITEEVSQEVLTVDELLAWGESIKPLAQQAFAGMGTFTPGEKQCKYCRGKALCRARANVNTALEEFKDCVPAGVWNEKAGDFTAAGGTVQGTPPPLLSDAEVGELLTRGAQLVQWYEDLQAYALEALLAGKEITGYKVVAGRSTREFKDTDAALQTLRAAGYDEAMLYDRKPKTLAQLEKMLGKGAFADLLGAQVVKPLGKPTLVTAADKREPYNRAAADFAEVTAK